MIIGHAMDACQFSPENAPQSITVVAIEVNAQIASFSNYGECVDIYIYIYILTPGEHVHRISNTSNTTLTSRLGTSFGTVQNPKDIRQYLFNMAAKDVVTKDLRGTPNVFLRSPVQLTFGNNGGSSVTSSICHISTYLFFIVILWSLLLTKFNVYYT